MRHFTEGELIAYQMGESEQSESIRRHLDICNQCGSVVESVAATLRMFSAGPVPPPDVSSAWAKLREILTVLDAPTPDQSSWWRRVSRPSRSWPLAFWPSAGLALSSLLLVVFLAVHHRTEPGRQPVTVNGLSVRDGGPLRTAPADPAVAAHLDNAERLLTQVNHEQGPLDAGTREQAQHLLLRNALYVETAHAHGDLAEATVLEDLGRVLTGLEHEPEAPKSTLRFRLEMNTDGLLLDIRILRQNDERKQ